MSGGRAAIRLWRYARKSRKSPALSSTPFMPKENRMPSQALSTL
eukprot:CAMPEP_0198459374 /NCGR_PEP_ID=MMETSP1453-20131121/40567_1 /TAXON_ID=1461543 ORGANISM="Unidentified sp., Strain RCC701" /NCGR_SAMPLE_ID=MMETSP1453 /ASSEMBLY_ACC=CAM_ASM_001118 /LENGTH=43 /DNA_ID= /DNA_START= /DNA_END= /DNA_ORIENTATION=